MEMLRSMTLTAPGCPVAGEMPVMVAEAISSIDGTGGGRSPWFGNQVGPKTV